MPLGFSTTLLAQLGNEMRYGSILSSHFNFHFYPYAQFGYIMTSFYYADETQVHIQHFSARCTVVVPLILTDNQPQAGTIYSTKSHAHKWEDHPLSLQCLQIRHF